MIIEEWYDEFKKKNIVWIWFKEDDEVSEYKNISIL